MSKEYTVDVVIPTYKPGNELAGLLSQLEKQTYLVNKVIIINTEAKYFHEEDLHYGGKLEVHHIMQKQFDHAAPRNYGILQSEADFVIFMTQDAIPYDENMVDELILAITKENVAVAYARQMPSYDCRMIERYTRNFNYPAKSRLKTKEDVQKIGIKAYFCSDVCAIYNRQIYCELGGFVRRAVFNEDMLFAAKAMDDGYGIYYAAKAKVVHSHNYTCMQQFHRNFDMGVSQAEHPEVFDKVKSEKEGMKLVWRTATFLRKHGRERMVPYLFVNSAFKYAGYCLGKRYQKLPMWFVRKCAMNKNYFMDMKKNGKRKIQERN